MSTLPEDMREKLDKLKLEFDIDECGIVNENGFYLIKKVGDLLQEVDRKAREETIKSLPTKQFKGRYGITSLEVLLDTLTVAENGGDVRECSAALGCIIHELQSPSKEGK